MPTAGINVWRGAPFQAHLVHELRRFSLSDLLIAAYALLRNGGFWKSKLPDVFSPAGDCGCR